MLWLQALGEIPRSYLGVEVKGLLGGLFGGLLGRCTLVSSHLTQAEAKCAIIRFVDDFEDF
jgi:hypothetical protein